VLYINGLGSALSEKQRPYPAAGQGGTAPALRQPGWTVSRIPAVAVRESLMIALPFARIFHHR
jgi:hypothetical protein